MSLDQKELALNLPPPESPPAGMHRRFDHATSVRAAERVAKHLTRLQYEVINAFRLLGPMTDGDLEKVPAFRVCAPSTVRKRRSELFQAQVLEKTGERRDGMNIWRLVGDQRMGGGGQHEE